MRENPFASVGMEIVKEATNGDEMSEKECARVLLLCNTLLQCSIEMTFTKECSAKAATPTATNVAALVAG